MDPFETYCRYLSLKLHFNSEYDYFKYSGKVNATVDAFRKRKDRIFFEKISKLHDPVGFMLANILHDPNCYIRDIATSQEAKDIYTKYLKKKESLSYVFTNEISSIRTSFNSIFICNDGVHPELLRLFLAETISLETLCILCDLTKCLDYWNKKLKDDIVYKDLELLIRKYTPFLTYEKAKFKKIIRDELKKNLTSSSSLL